MCRLRYYNLLFCLALIAFILPSSVLQADELPLVQEFDGGVRCELQLEPKLHFVFTGVDRDVVQSPAAHLAISVDRAASQKPPIALLGTFEADDQSVSFIPRFPLSPEVVYAVRLSDARDAKKSLLRFQLPGLPKEPPAVVEAVFPAGDQLPENLLKFYIQFSRPMKRGEAYQYIKLYRDDTLVESPFLELGEELWDPKQTRFTLFVHPGRIKRGLKPRRDDGPSLAGGGSYRLEIAQAWQSADGQSLASKHVKQFTASPADHTQPDPANWKIDIPAAQSREPVSLTFAEPLDHAMLSRVLQVVDVLGEVVPGEVSLSGEQDRWSFTPQDDWPIGTYSIGVDTNLEDLCGNSIARPFEVKQLAEGEDPSVPVPTIAVEFVVK